MDWSTILVAILAMIGTVIGSVLSANKTQALLAFRLERLEKAVEAHNKVVERVYAVERDINTAFIRIDEIKHDIEEVKRHD